MSGQTAAGARQQAAYTSLYATGVATTASYADVTFTDTAGRSVTEIPAGFAISLIVEAIAATQAVNVKVLHRSHPSATWRELAAETAVGTSSVTEVYADIVRGAQIKVQIKEGTTSGGTGTISLCLK